MAQFADISDVWGAPFQQSENSNPLLIHAPRQPNAGNTIVPRADMSKVRAMDDDDEPSSPITQNPSVITGSDDVSSGGSDTPRTMDFGAGDVGVSSVRNAQLISDQLRALQQKITGAERLPPVDAPVITLTDVFAKLNEVLMAVVGDSERKRETRNPLMDVLVIGAIGVFMIQLLDMVMRLGQSMAKSAIRFR